MRAIDRTLRRGILGLAAVAACGSGPPARCALPGITALRAEVDAAIGPPALPADFAARAAAARHLVELHERIVGDPRLASTPALENLRRRVATRLTRLRCRLEHDIVVADSAATLRSTRLEPPTAGGQAADARHLVDLIQATVRPDSWDVNGGTGTIRYFANGHALVVSAPEEVHEELGDLLRKLR